MPSPIIVHSPNDSDLLKHCLRILYLDCNKSHFETTTKRFETLNSDLQKLESGLTFMSRPLPEFWKIADIEGVLNTIVADKYIFSLPYREDDAIELIENFLDTDNITLIVSPERYDEVKLRLSKYTIPIYWIYSDQLIIDLKDIGLNSYLVHSELVN